MANTTPMAQISALESLNQIGDIFKLSPGDFISGNKDLLNRLLQYNLLWSAVFLAGIWMLWDTVAHYLPIVKRIPFISSFFSTVWFTSSLLLTIIIYGSANNTAVRAFGFIFILLLLFSVVLALWRLGSAVALLIAHKSILIASRGPYVVAINGTYFSSDFIPGAVVIKTCSGSSHYYQGTFVGNGDIKTLNVSLYSGRHHIPFENHRNSSTSKDVNLRDGHACAITVFTPVDVKSVKSV